MIVSFLVILLLSFSSKVKTHLPISLAFYAVLYTNISRSGINSIYLFEQSADFRTNLYSQSIDFCGLDPQLIKCFSHIASKIIPISEYLVYLWSLIPVLLIWAILDLSRRFVILNYKSSTLIRLFCASSCFLALLFVTRGYFGAVDLFSSITIPTSHIFMQSLASVLLLPPLFYPKLKILLSNFLVIASVIIHPVALIYVVFARNIPILAFKKITASKKKLLGVNIYYFIFAILLTTLGPLALFLLYSNYIAVRGDSIELLSQVSMGVGNTLFLSSSLALSIGFIICSVTYLNKLRVTHINSDLALSLNSLKNLIIWLSFLSSATSIVSTDMAYRINYIIYVYSPVLLFVISLIASLGILKSLGLSRDSSLGSL